MFSFRAHSAMYFIRHAAHATFTKETKMLLINNVSFTKTLCSDSKLNFVKPNKATKSNTLDDKNLGPSKLYPDDWEKATNYDVVKHFDFMNDDEKESSMQENSKLDEPKNIRNMSENVKGENIFFEVNNNEDLATEVDEKVSDSDDSDSDIENRESDATYFDDNKPKKEFRSINSSIYNMNFNTLPRKSQDLRSLLDPKTLKMNDKVAIDDYGAVCYLARNGVIPKKIFFLRPKVLSFFSSSLSGVELYKISHYDLKYWAPSVSPAGVNLIALYGKEQLKVDMGSEDQEFPITVLCAGFKDKILLGTIMYTACVGSCKLFLNAGDISPWDSMLLRSSFYSSFSMNHYFNLSWRDIYEKIPQNDKVLLIPWGTMHDWARGKRSDFEPSNIPSVDLYDHNLWDGESMTLIMGVPCYKHVSFSEFCSDRKVRKINIGLNKKVLPSASFSMVFFELRRQWLAKKNRKISRQSDNQKTSKVRVEIVSTLFNI